MSAFGAEAMRTETLNGVQKLRLLKILGGTG